MLNDVTFTAAGGSIGPFRYVVLYNDTPTSPADPLIGWYDYGTNLDRHQRQFVSRSISTAATAC